jgi:hypothetical protein
MQGEDAGANGPTRFGLGGNERARWGGRVTTPRNPPVARIAHEGGNLTARSASGQKNAPPWSGQADRHGAIGTALWPWKRAARARVGGYAFGVLSIVPYDTRVGQSIGAPCVEAKEGPVSDQITGQCTHALWAGGLWTRSQHEACGSYAPSVVARMLRDGRKKQKNDLREQAWARAFD